MDDHADSRDLFATILSRRGVEVTAVDTVREGLAAARRVRPDVIVCDLAMPGDDGFVLIREIRSWPSRPGHRGTGGGAHRLRATWTAIGAAAGSSGAPVKAGRAASSSKLRSFASARRRRVEQVPHPPFRR